MCGDVDEGEGGGRHLLAEHVLMEHLLAAGLLQGGTVEEMKKVHLGAIFMPHGLGHFLVCYADHFQHVWCVSASLRVEMPRGVLFDSTHARVPAVSASRV
jgi:hypothetical protein